MSSNSSPWSLRRRAYGPRCGSPPTFVCYELPQPDHYSRSPTPSSGDEDNSGDEKSPCHSDNSNSDDDQVDARSSSSSTRDSNTNKPNEASNEAMTMDIQQSTLSPPSTDAVTSANVESCHSPPPAASATIIVSSESESDSGGHSRDKRWLQEKREGKRKEVCSPPPFATPDATSSSAQPSAVNITPSRKPNKERRQKPTRRQRREDSGPPVRPILTIRSSQGFVWNQDLFIPAYIKERYIASSPPSSMSPGYGTPPSNKAALSNNNFFSSSSGTDYEVECVEIRVVEGELDGLLPRSRR